MSRSGILVAWNAEGTASMLPKAGDLLSIDIELPANHSFGRRCIHCQAVVVRIGQPEEPGVAVQVSQMQFRSYEQGGNGTESVQHEVRCSVI